MEAGRNVEMWKCGEAMKTPIFLFQANASGASEAANVLQEISRDFAACKFHYTWLCLTKFHVWRKW